MSKSLLAWNLAYNAWATRRLLGACLPLSRDELERDLGVAHGSILRTMQHMYGSDWFWLSVLHGAIIPPLAEHPWPGPPDEHPDFDSLQRLWPPVLDGLCAALRSREEPEEIIRGADCEVSLSRLVLHIVNHASLHRGQITALLRQLGHTPPNLDVFAFHVSP